jgi:hypothetical protein
MNIFNPERTKKTKTTQYSCLKIQTNSNSQFYFNWLSIRKHWKKNRILFNLIFLKIYFPLKYLRILEKKKKIDLNLILAWKRLKYINLCSTTIIQKIVNTKKRYFCLESLINRPVHKIFFIEEITGCICCAKDLKRQGPIWWNEWDRVKSMLKSKMNYFLVLRLYQFSLLKDFKIFQIKKKILFTKLSKIFRYFPWEISFLPKICDISKNLTVFVFFKFWIFIY